MNDWLPILATTLAAATPLIFAGLGELVTERAGVLNLGVEGMMLIGAVSAFAVASSGGGLLLGTLAGIGAGMAASALFALLVLHCLANQMATGLALALFGVGLSAFIGRDYVSHVLDGVSGYTLLDGLPPLDPFIVGSLGLFALVQWFLYRSRGGLVLRAVGESPSTAHALGYPVRLIRWAAILFGGACSGLAGAYLATDYTPMWVEGLSAGRGWIALALVVFATWKPARLLAGAYLFGGVTILQFHGQALGLAVPSQFMSMLPYLATIVVLTLISRRGHAIRLNAPASLGQVWHPDS
ncbi:ABC transporter permease [Plasticicumulans acidivorans]|uniref:Nucleoside ABC transporter membrane protein n=1 Tax=Plasticicumulans acidivorans TaxID=886464 RepID=A0A317MU58_9GAMM|nr:ABC transporter permease [Plasticicumulans acidivorans]PWV61129.1 nucleoside ABC transporter membrane protein [Plasticicumulans acidivorans]